jgi:hypothetical protein
MAGGQPRCYREPICEDEGDATHVSLDYRMIPQGGRETSDQRSGASHPGELHTVGSGLVLHEESVGGLWHPDVGVAR